MIDVSFSDLVAALHPVTVREETAADAPAREALLDAGLGAGRHLKTCERLRVGRAPARGLALVAAAGDRLVGSVRLWNIVAGDRPAVLLGPLCVEDGRRSQGIGGRLVAESLFRAMAGGHRAVLLVGDAAYYGRFGFARRLTRGLRLPGPVQAERFLGLELVEGALQGATGAVVAANERSPRMLARAALRAA